VPPPAGRPRETSRRWPTEASASRRVSIVLHRRTLPSPPRERSACFRRGRVFLWSSQITHPLRGRSVPPPVSQSNGKIERWHKSLKAECIRPGTPLSLDDARRLVAGYVEHYNNVRLNSAIGYIRPKDMLAGRQQEIHAERDRKLEEARKRLQQRRQEAA
jgi:transposase InsO family protein